MTIELRSARLLLRPPAPDDRAAWLRMDRENEAFWAPWSPRRDPSRSPDEHFDEALSRSEQGLRDGSAYRFLAFHEGAIVGLCGLNNIVRRAFQNAAMGWRVTQAAEGRGLAFEMVWRVLSFAFEAEPAGLGLHRVEANIIPRNSRSLRLADRLGFRREGLGVRLLRINDTWEDHVLCAKLADEHAGKGPPPISSRR